MPRVAARLSWKPASRIQKGFTMSRSTEAADMAPSPETRRPRTPPPRYRRAIRVARAMEPLERAIAQ